MVSGAFFERSTRTVPVEDQRAPAVAQRVGHLAVRVGAAHHGAAARRALDELAAALAIDKTKDA